MRRRLKSLRMNIYQFLYTWALDRWNKELGVDNFKRPTGKVSNHALMCYAERIDGYNFDRAINKILTSDAKAQIKRIGGNGKFSLDGISYIVRSGVVITLAKADGVKSFLTFQPIDENDSRGRKWTF